LSFPGIFPLSSEEAEPTPIVLFVGRFEANKGADLFYALANISKELKFQLVIMGFVACCNYVSAVRSNAKT
jgi:glycosyltransferase involved in cell wall biosynthesis